MADEARPPLLVEFERYLSLERGLSPRTVSAYGSDVGAFLGWAKLKKIEPRDANKSILDDFLWDAKARGLSATSLFRKVEALKSFFAYQAIEGRLPENPAENLKGPRLPKRLPKYLSKS